MLSAIHIPLWGGSEAYAPKADSSHLPTLRKYLVGSVDEVGDAEEDGWEWLDRAAGEAEND